MTTQTAINESEIRATQKAWADGILAIRGAYLEGGDYTAAAREFIAKHYAYDLGPVLFKPTLASVSQFRLDIKGALSYFVAGNDQYPEDRGFAILPWVSIRFEPAGFLYAEGYAATMGNYYLTNENGDEIKVEYTMGFVRDAEGALRIALHHSSVPYSPVIG